jgi:hypothetical protein
MHPLRCIKLVEDCVVIKYATGLCAESDMCAVLSSWWQQLATSARASSASACRALAAGCIVELVSSKNIHLYVPVVLVVTWGSGTLLAGHTHLVPFQTFCQDRPGDGFCTLLCVHASLACSRRAPGSNDAA